MAQCALAPPPGRYQLKAIHGLDEPTLSKFRTSHPKLMRNAEALFHALAYDLPGAVVDGTDPHAPAINEDAWEALDDDLSEQYAPSEMQELLDIPVQDARERTLRWAQQAGTAYATPGCLSWDPPALEMLAEQNSSCYSTAVEDEQLSTGSWRSAYDLLEPVGARLTFGKPMDVVEAVPAFNSGEIEYEDLYRSVRHSALDKMVRRIPIFVGREMKWFEC